MSAEVAARGDGLRRAQRHEIVRADRLHGEDSMRAFAKLTTLVDRESRIAADSALLVPLAAMPAAEARSVQTQLTAILTSYQRTLQSDRRFLLSRFQVADIARQVVGIGSVACAAG